MKMIVDSKPREQGDLVDSAATRVNISLNITADLSQW